LDYTSFTPLIAGIKGRDRSDMLASRHLRGISSTIVVYEQIGGDGRAISPLSPQGWNSIFF
jgi:hypothetical protein